MNLHNREFAQTVRVAVYVYFWRRPCVMPSIDVYLRFFIHERVDGLHHLRNLIFWTYVSDAKISRAIKNASLDYHQKYTYTATRTFSANSLWSKTLLSTHTLHVTSFNFNKNYLLRTRLVDFCLLICLDGRLWNPFLSFLIWSLEKLANLFH